MLRKKMLTDYDRTVKKSVEENRRKRSEETQQTQTANLGMSQQDLERLAKEAGLTVNKLLGREDVEMAEEV